MPPDQEDSTSQVAKGSILNGPYWPELVRVLSAQVRDERIEIEAVGVQTEHYCSILPKGGFIPVQCPN
jgi:hypothetical protein